MLVLLGAGAAHAGSWRDLWWTHDQQGQKLLAANQPAAAAKVFDDSRRRAYAQLEAGHYAEAAKDLEPYKDADSQYNRGNALAHTGRLKEALAAYDAALAAAPGNRDVIKNRDLVKRALEKQRRTGQSQKPSGSGASSADDKGGGKDAGGKAGANANDGGAGVSSSGQQSAAQQSGSRDSGGSNTASGRGDSRSANAGDEHREYGANSAGNRRGESGRPNAGEERRKSGSTNPADRSTQTSQARNEQHPGAADNSAQQGQLAATASSAAQSTDHASPAAAQGQTSDTNRDAVRNEVARTLQNPHAKAPTSAPPQQPPSEQALALDQWLRTIPDDSGELLQRKFMIEHLMKQRGNEP